MNQERIADIYQCGKQYDRLFTSGSQDLSFWINQARECGGNILELACGTGRLTIPLAKAGFDVTGIDVADGMLKEAMNKAANAGVKVAWIKDDMRDFNLNRSFSLIFLAGNSLCHLLTLNDLESCLSAVKNHLVTDGRFIIDVFVPKMELLLSAPDKRFLFSEYDDPDGRGMIKVTESYEYEPDTQIKRIKTYHAFPGQDDEIEGELNMRMYFPQELDALLTYNGFTIENKYGSTDLTAFDKESENQLIVCRLM